MTMRFGEEFLTHKRHGTSGLRGPAQAPSTPTGTLALTDITYLGSYNIPQPSPAGGFPGWTFPYLGGPCGLTVRYQDGEVHLLAATTNSNTQSGFMGHFYEWLDHTPFIPSSNVYSPASYPTATMRQEYPNPYGSGAFTEPIATNNFKRKMYYGNDLTDFASYGLTAAGSIYWDPTDSRLYWCYNFSYGSGGLSQSDQQYSLGYSELNYLTAATTAHGSWRLSATQYMGCNAGFVSIPSSFVSANGLGAKRLGVLGTSQVSTVAGGDNSFGPSLTAFSPNFPAELQTHTDSQKLVSYAPWTIAPATGFDRCNRYYRFEDTDEFLDYQWDEGKWSDQDFTYGGAWIHGPNKSGFLTIGQMCKGYPTYLDGAQFSESYYVQLNIYSEADLASVAAGAAPNSIQPAVYDFTALMPIDPIEIESLVLANITSITAPAGEIQTLPTSITPGPGATVITATPHGLATGNTVFIHNANVAEYNNGWHIIVQSPTQFLIGDGNHTGRFWSGATANTGILKGGGNLRSPFGMAFDEATNKLYVGWYSYLTAGMISVYQVNC